MLKMTNPYCSHSFTYVNRNETFCAHCSENISKPKQEKEKINVHQFSLQRSHCDTCKVDFYTWSDYVQHFSICKKPIETKMKKYRAKIDTTVCPKGTTFTYFPSGDGTWIADTKGPTSFAIDHPEKYPDWLELIEEKSDKVILGEWLIKNYRRWFTGDDRCGQTSYELLKANAINPEFLNRLRKEQNG